MSEMRAHGKMVGVWIDTTAPYSEDFSLYEKVYDMKIDMITTDFPLEAQRALTQIHLSRSAVTPANEASNS